MPFWSSKIKSNILVVSTLLYVFLCGGLPAGLTFCFGADGHIAFEAFDIAGNCAFGINDVDVKDGQATCSERDNHCGTCVDVVPGIGRISPAFKPDVLSVSYVISTLLPDVFINWKSFPTVLSLPLSLPFSVPLVSIFSTVLLI